MKVPKTFGKTRERSAKTRRRIQEIRNDLESRKSFLARCAIIKRELEKARLEFEAARRKDDLTRMAELQYARIPELEKQLAEATKGALKKEKQLLRNKVTDEEMAEVVSKWTHIPVSKMLESEKEKLLQMEDALA